MKRRFGKRIALIATLLSLTVVACIEYRSRTSYATCNAAACRDTRTDPQLGRTAHGPRGVAVLRDFIAVLKTARTLELYDHAGVLKRTHTLSFDAMRVYAGGANDVWLLSSFTSSYTLYRARIAANGALPASPEARQATRHMYPHVLYRDRYYFLEGVEDVALTSDGGRLFVAARFRHTATGEELSAIVRYVVFEDATESSLRPWGVQWLPFDWRRGPLSRRLRIDVDDASRMLFALDAAGGHLTRFDYELEPLAEVERLGKEDEAPILREGSPGYPFVQDFEVEDGAVLVGTTTSGGASGYAYELRAYALSEDVLYDVDRTEAAAVNALASRGTQAGVGCGEKPGGYLWQVTGTASGSASTLVRHLVCDTR